MVPALIAVIPAVLLYLQNKQSGDREERAVKARQQHDERMRELETGDQRRREVQQRREAAVREQQEIILRFQRVGRRVILESYRAARQGASFYLTDQLASEFSEVSELMSLHSDEGVRDAAERFKGLVDIVLTDFNNSNDLDLERYLSDFRNVARAYLNDATLTHGASDPAGPGSDAIGSERDRKRI